MFAWDLSHISKCVSIFTRSLLYMHVHICEGWERQVVRVKPTLGETGSE